MTGERRRRPRNAPDAPGPENATYPDYEGPQGISHVPLLAFKTYTLAYPLILPTSQDYVSSSPKECQEEIRQWLAPFRVCRRVGTADGSSYW